MASAADQISGPFPAGPSFGDVVTFAVSTSKTDKPWLDVKCFQGGTLVYEQIVGEFPSYPEPHSFTLGPTRMWTGGAADGTAELVKRDQDGRRHVLAKVKFEVAA